jgi:hypothetical protein
MRNAISNQIFSLAKRSYIHKARNFRKRIAGDMGSLRRLLVVDRGTIVVRRFSLFKKAGKGFSAVVAIKRSFQYHPAERRRRIVGSPLLVQQQNLYYSPDAVTARRLFGAERMAS